MQQQQNQQNELTKKQLKKREKLAKKEAKRHAKLQKKKDKLGSFSTNVGELPDKSKFRSAHVVTTNINGGNYPVAATRNNNYGGQQVQSRQPVESMRG